MKKPTTPRAPKPGTIPHAAARLGVTKPTIYKLVRMGQLRAYKAGSATRITDAAIEDFIANAERANPLRRAEATA